MRSVLAPAKKCRMKRWMKNSVKEQQATEKSIGLHGGTKPGLMVPQNLLNQAESAVLSDILHMTSMSSKVA